MQIAELSPLRERVERLQEEVLALPQYEPKTEHYFHAGMYCREVFRDAGVLVIGKVHRKEHFYVIISGTVAITTDDGIQEVTGPKVLLCKPGTKRAVYALTPSTCMTFHVTDSKTPEEAEIELVEEDLRSTYLPGNKLKQEVLS